MKNSLWVLFAAFSVSSLISCDKEKLIEGNGNPTTETRIIQNFNTLILKMDYNVTIIQDSLEMVEVYAESNLIRYIDTYVSGKDLVIREKNSYKIDYNVPVVITVHTTQVEYIDLLGSGMIETGNLNTPLLDIDILGSGTIEAYCNTDKLSVNISGSGYANIVGYSDEAYYRTSGSGHIQAYNMFAENCHAKISGSGNIYLYAVNYLNVSISGSGSVFYKGNPLLDSSITGSGTIIHVP
ncbi:MAG: DUF2807 domain-containing protein [Bacteroidetes bacterium]|nr:DUF2807 domain-containing protein [Bacteroidota bacterium]